MATTAHTEVDDRSRAQRAWDLIGAVAPWCFAVAVGAAIAFMTDLVSAEQDRANLERPPQAAPAPSHSGPAAPAPRPGATSARPNTHADLPVSQGLQLGDPNREP